MTEQSNFYEIRVKGHLDPHWSAWFDGMELRHTTLNTEPITLIAGIVQDQAALYGIICHLRDLGVPLISVHPRPDTDFESPNDEDSIQDI